MLRSALSVLSLMASEWSISTCPMVQALAPISTTTSWLGCPAWSATSEPSKQETNLYAWWEISTSDLKRETSRILIACQEESWPQIAKEPPYWWHWVLIFKMLSDCLSRTAGTGAGGITAVALGTATVAGVSITSTSMKRYAS